LVTLLLSSPVHAQTMADVFQNNTDVTWVGLDFSRAKLVPTFEFVEVESDAPMALVKWNNLLEQEPDKFNLGRALGITRYSINTTFMREVNKDLTAESLLGREPYSLDPSAIPEM